jgi:large subunit ribosomal protein L6
MSRIGKKAIFIPKNVKVDHQNGLVTVEGSKGKLTYTIPPSLTLEVNDSQILIKRQSESKIDRSAHGLARALINNMIKGVTDGFSKELEIEGVGFRAQVQGKILNLQLGFSHSINFNIPEGIVIETPKPNQIAVKGIDKSKVGEVAAEIRAFYPPEPYKGKGIHYVGEYIRRKAGKTVA